MKCKVCSKGKAYAIGACRPCLKKLSGDLDKVGGLKRAKK